MAVVIDRIAKQRTKKLTKLCQCSRVTARVEIKVLHGLGSQGSYRACGVPADGG